MYFSTTGSSLSFQTSQAAVTTTSGWAADAYRFCLPNPPHPIIPRLILSGAEIDTNVRFLADYLSSDSIDSRPYIDKEAIAQLNQAAISKSVFSGGLEIYVSTHAMGIKSEGESVNIDASNELIAAYSFVFNEDMTLLYARNNKTVDDRIGYESSNKLIYLNVNVNHKIGTILASINNGYQKFEISGEKELFIDRKLMDLLIEDLVNRRTYESINQHAAQVDRYIAHAGGEIDGEIYTNSLEALTKSYLDGFRLFELDIIRTSDGHFVAAHDWELWSEMTSYDGELPPDLKEFKKKTWEHVGQELSNG